MKTYRWAKLWIDILDDWKWGTLPDSSKVRFIECMLVAKEYNAGGVLPPLREMAYRLRIDTDTLTADLMRLAQNELVELTVYNSEERWWMPNFEKRQETPMTSTERVQAFRERKAADPVKENVSPIDVYGGLPEKPGVYSITIGDMEYIGTSVNIRRRVRQHLVEMKNQPSHIMHADYQDYGLDNITIRVLEVVEDRPLHEAETKWIESRNPDKLYNKESKGKRHHSHNGTLTERHVSQEVEVEAEVEKKQKQKQSGLNAVASAAAAAFLEQFGLSYNDKTAPLVGLPSDYIRAHLDYAKRNGERTGLAIRRMIDGDPAPGLRKAIPDEYADVVRR